MANMPKKCVIALSPVFGDYLLLPQLASTVDILSCVTIVINFLKITKETKICALLVYYSSH